MKIMLVSCVIQFLQNSWVLLMVIGLSVEGQMWCPTSPCTIPLAQIYKIHFHSAVCILNLKRHLFAISAGVMGIYLG
jgi:hypothetical protein